jgi:lipopolysaccharide/colanic/teichoic acid biosynthesis glycosyltransferase
MINITQSLLTKRYFDLLLVMIVVILLIIPVFLVAIVVRLTSKGPVLYWSNRIGKNNKIFSMPKFRIKNDLVWHLKEVSLILTELLIDFQYFLR